jgi:hypothetical protein
LAVSAERTHRQNGDRQNHNPAIFAFSGRSEKDFSHISHLGRERLYMVLIEAARPIHVQQTTEYQD